MTYLSFGTITIQKLLMDGLLAIKSVKHRKKSQWLDKD